MGRLVDRGHGRQLVAICAGLGACVLLGVSRITELWQFYALYGLAMGPLMRGTMLATQSAVANWFVRRRAVATSIASLGTPLGGIAVLPLTQALISGFDWRIGWVGLACVMAVLVGIPGGVFLRRRPEDVGLLPDGDRFAAGAAGDAQREALAASLSREPRWTARQAMRTSAFWYLVVAFALTYMGVGAFVTNGQSHFTLATGNGGQAAAAMAAFAWGTLVSRAVWTPLTMHLGSRRTLVLAIATTAVGFFAVANARVPAAMYPTAAFLGLGMGILNPLGQQVWPDFYGRLSVGAIRGSAMSFLQFATAFGPFVASGIFDLLGSYPIAFSLFGVTYSIAAILVFVARPPRSPLAAEVSAAAA